MQINNIDNINFQNRKIHNRRRIIKNLEKRIGELTEEKSILEKNSKALEVTISKTTTLDPYSPAAEKTSKLWQLLYDYQYNLIFGNYKDYKNAKINYSKEAAENLNLIKYVKSPFNGQTNLFSKTGLNITKNLFLDLFRFKTFEEKILMNYTKENQKNAMKNKILGII